MSDSNEVFGWTRRAVVRALGGLLGTGAVAGAAGARPDNPIRGAGAPYDLDDDWFSDATLAGAHSLAAPGPASRTGRSTQRHDGDRNMSVAVHGDLAAVSFLSSGEADPGRRLALLDVTEFNDASTPAELEAAEFTVLSIYRSPNAEANSAHALRFSADGNYLFLATAAFLPFTDGFHGGSHGERVPSDPRSTPQVSGGVVAVDVSDPTNPTTADSLTAPFTTGAVDVSYHRIDGTEYVFAAKDFGFFAPDSGVYVLRFDREAGKLSVVNRWTDDGNTVRGGVGTEHGQPGPESGVLTAFSYVSDVTVHDDPRTGRPTAYVADWNGGMRVLDVSEPTNIDHVGQFDAYQAHFAAPAPTLVETPDGREKRVAVLTHEEYDDRFDQRDDDNFMNPHEDKTNPNSTGTVFLVDCDGIYPEDPGDAGGSGPTQLGELANWTWANADTDPGVSHRDLRFKRRHLSPHSASFERHEVDGEQRLLLHTAHFHGGVRYLEVRPGTDEGLVGEARRSHRVEPNPAVERTEEIGWVNATTDWALAETGHARPRDEPNDRATPRVSGTAGHNGVTFAVGQWAGAYATHHESVPLRPPLPAIDGSRSYGAGPTRTASRIEITLDSLDREDTDLDAVRVRDRLPDGWTVLDGDVETYPQGVRTAVEFERTLDPGEETTLTYRVETPDDGVTRGAFGPVEVSTDGEEWVELEGTLQDVTAGPSI